MTRLMQRTAIALGLATLGGAAMAGGPLEDAFAARSPEVRMAVQQQAQAEGFYEGTIDGVWGPGTNLALMTVVDTLMYTAGAAAPNLGDPDWAADFLDELASGGYADELAHARSLPPGSGMD